MDAFSRNIAEAYLLAKRCGFTATAKALHDLARYDSTAHRDILRSLHFVNLGGLSVAEDHQRGDVKGDEIGVAKET